MNIYFAGSIRGGRDDKDLYADIIELLKKYGTVLTEHIGDKTLSVLGEDGPTEEYIYDRDMAWLEESDAIVAEVTTPSLGVGYELGRGERKKLPILCLYREEEGKRLSAMIGGNKSFIVREYQTLEDLPEIFDTFFHDRS